MGAAGQGGGGEDEVDALSYQDMSQPIHVIARRLHSYDAHLRASAEVWQERQRRLLHASFVVEFGLEHGLSEMRDATSEATLKEFMQRLGEWEGAHEAGTGEIVRSLVLGHIPAGPAARPLRSAVMDWALENKGHAVLGGAIIGGVLGAVVAGTAIAVTSALSARRGGAGR